MYDGASLARKVAGPVISSTLAQRCIGTVAIVALDAVSSAHRPRLSSVAVQPGHSALTRTPWLAHSAASVLVSEISPALAAPYGASAGDAIRPAMEATLMTEPWPRLTRWPPSAWHTYTADVRLSLMILSQPGSLRSRNGTAKFEPP